MTKGDPLILTQLPDVFVAGNQPRLEFRTVRLLDRDVLLLALPAFARSGAAALLHLESNEVQVLQFGEHVLSGAAGDAGGAGDGDGDGDRDGDGEDGGEGGDQVDIVIDDIQAGEGEGEA